MGGDGQTVFDLAGTGTKIFSGGLFPGVNSDLWGHCGPVPAKEFTLS